MLFHTLLLYISGTGRGSHFLFLVSLLVVFAGNFRATLLIMVHASVSRDTVRCTRLPLLIGLVILGLVRPELQGAIIRAYTVGCDDGARVSSRR